MKAVTEMRISGRKCRLGPTIGVRGFFWSEGVQSTAMEVRVSVMKETQISHLGEQGNDNDLAKRQHSHVKTI